VVRPAEVKPVTRFMRFSRFIHQATHFGAGANDAASSASVFTTKERCMTAIIRLTVTAAAACLVACAGSRGADTALTDTKSVVHGNSHSFQAPRDLTLRVVTGTLVQKGFAIEQTDSAMGLVKATRNLTDPKDPNTNYHVTATAYVASGPDGRTSVVDLAASQQTVLYRQGHTWTLLPLLPIIPIPTGRKFESVVTGEGSILEGNFYAEFFDAVERGLANASNFNATTLAAGAEESAQSPKAPAAGLGTPATAASKPH
jgi:hypothetical protein